jgi:apolipoprotein N-acyltransferase
MPLHAIAESAPAANNGPASSAAAGPHPALPATVSGFLLWSTFPPTGWSWLVWGALVPLFFLVESPRSRVSVYAGTWAGGLVFWLLAIEWLRLIDADAWLGWVVMGLVLSAWWPAFLLCTRVAVRRYKVPMLVAAPVVWVALEYTRAHIMSGFPWYYLAHSQHNALPVIQIADLTGALGLSFLIAMVNAWLVEAWKFAQRFRASADVRPTRSQWTGAAVVALLLAGTLGYGWYRIATAAFHDGPKVALLQSNLIQRHKMSSDPKDILKIYASLIAQACANRNRTPELIVWPETSYPYHFIFRDAKITQAAFESQAKALDPKLEAADWTDWQREVSRDLHEVTERYRAPMLVGVLSYEFGAEFFAKYNTALLFEPGLETIQRFAKIHLVPFGEYVPLIKYLPWLTALTPYHGSNVPDLTFGREATTFRLGRYRFATAICFEDTIPQLVRRFFQPTDGVRQPDFLVNISNDGWFLHDPGSGSPQGSAEHDMHLAISVFRAVENRVPLARAANTGVSALIDGNGSVLSRLEKATAGVLSGIIPLDDRESFYSASGDWFGLSCLAATAVLLIFWIAQSLRPRRLV